jgi:hypothetical protein
VLSVFFLLTNVHCKHKHFCFANVCNFVFFIVKFEQIKCQDLVLGLFMVVGNWDLVLSFNLGFQLWV